jgi:hypothetical protein
MKIFLITTLAKYQTEFWIKIAKNIETDVAKVILLAFDDESVDLLKLSGCQFYKIASYDEIGSKSIHDIYEHLQLLGISDIDFWLRHQTYVFKSNDKEDALHRLYAAFVGVNQIIKSLNYKHLYMIQELGGFSSVVGSYFAAINNGVDNFFIEPSFFKGRIFFLKNTFNAIKLKKTNKNSETEVRNYINNILKYKELSIPKKDVHQFVPAYRKILNSKNFLRFIEKITKKYILGKKFEFDGIISYANKHIKMSINHIILSPIYNYATNRHNDKKIIYYPLHVPNDMSLTIRAPDKLNQLCLVEQICKELPDGYYLYIKEHPAMIGSVNVLRLIFLLRKYRNIKIIHPSINNIDLIQLADIVVTVNSKAGAEAILLNKHVIALGDSFYSESGLVVSVGDMSELRAALQVKRNDAHVNEKDILSFFSQVWNNSYPGELYYSDVANILSFSRSIYLATN